MITYTKTKYNLLFLLLTFCFSFNLAFGQSNERFKNLIKTTTFNNKLILGVDENHIHEFKNNSDFQIRGKYVNGTYLVLVDKSKASKISSDLKNQLYQIDPSIKISNELATQGQVEIAISFVDDLSEEQVENIRNDFGISSNEFNLYNSKLTIGKINANMINALASMPEVASIEPITEEPEPLGDKSLSFGNVEVLHNTDLYGLTGDGVVTGVGDGGELGNHIDFKGRNINYAAGTYSSYGDHGDKVAGIIGAAGNLDEKYKGIAPDANILTQKTYRIFYYIDQYYNNNGMVITNNSYGTSFSCTDAGAYQYYSMLMDQQMNTYEDVLHCVAAGNNGTSTCGDFPEGYGTVLKIYAAAKNVLTVGGINYEGVHNPWTSKGPVQDGRLKPEVVTLSFGMTSTSNNYNYGGFGGSSGATANASGIATLLYEQYKNINNENPKGSLIKAVMCNTADDKGNFGPDYIYGYGALNAEKAALAIQNNQFDFGETTSVGEEITFTIPVTANQKDLRVMLYWNDIESTIFNVKALINDLDLKVVAPDGTEILPYVLNPNPANVADVATRGIDRLNNGEQVIINNPQAGNYTIKVRTHMLSAASQKFVITYHTNHQDELKINYPVQNQKLLPSENIYINWTSNLDNVTGYALHYSSDNGATWNLINETIDASAVSFSWNTPAINSSAVKLKLTAQGTSEEFITDAFSVLNRPSTVTATAECGQYVHLNWTASTDALAYEVYRLGTEKMELIATVTDTEYLAGDLNVGTDEWFSVRAVYDGNYTSRRTVAVSATPNGNYPCDWSNDVEVISLELMGPSKGRAYTSTSLSATTGFQLQIVNAGNNTLTEIPLDIVINGNLYTENINETVNPGDTVNYVTASIYDLTAAGTHTIDVQTNLSGDLYGNENYFTVSAEQLPNPQLPIPFYFFIGGLDDINLTSYVHGVPSLPMMDFNTSGNGSLTSQVNTDDTAEVLVVENTAADSQSELTMTFNLDGASSIRLYNRSSYLLEIPNGDNTSEAVLEVRGSESDSWLTLLQLSKSNDWIKVENLDIYETLGNNGQSYSSSTQLRWVVSGNARLQLDEISMTDIVDDNALPVEMVYFRAQKVRNDAVLEWKTASEENNDFFEVQVAEGTEALNEGNFRKLGIVDGNGTVLDEQLYVFNDVETYKSGVRYYRLKQVDFDGAFEYSDIVSVDFTEKEANQIAILPNVVVSEENSTIYFELNKNATVDLILADASGRVIQRIKEDYNAGLVSVDLKITSNMAPGVYFLSGKINNETAASRLIKVNE